MKYWLYFEFLHRINPAAVTTGPQLVKMSTKYPPYFSVWTDTLLVDFGGYYHLDRPAEA